MLRPIYGPAGLTINCMATHEPNVRYGVLHIEWLLKQLIESYDIAPLAYSKVVLN